jgi:hypothetical protein
MRRATQARSTPSSSPSWPRSIGQDAPLSAAGVKARVSGRSAAKSAAVAALLGDGSAVRVLTRKSGGAWPIWTPDRAAAAGLRTEGGGVTCSPVPTCSHLFPEHVHLTCSPPYRGNRWNRWPRDRAIDREQVGRPELSRPPAADPGQADPGAAAARASLRCFRMRPGGPATAPASGSRHGSRPGAPCSVTGRTGRTGAPCSRVFAAWAPGLAGRPARTTAPGRTDAGRSGRLASAAAPLATLAAGRVPVCSGRGHAGQGMARP